MIGFIKVKPVFVSDGSYSDATMYIRAAHITSVRHLSKENAAFIYLLNEQNPIRTEESAEEILTQIGIALNEERDHIVHPTPVVPKG